MLSCPFCYAGYRECRKEQCALYIEKERGGGCCFKEAAKALVILAATVGYDVSTEKMFVRIKE